MDYGTLENINARADPSAFGKAMADKPGSATQGVIKLKDCMNRCQSISRWVSERGRSGYVFRRREGGPVLRNDGRHGVSLNKRSPEGGLVLRSHRLDKASKSKRHGEGGWSLVEMT